VQAVGVVQTRYKSSAQMMTRISQGRNDAYCLEMHNIIQKLRQSASGIYQAL